VSRPDRYGLFALALYLVLSALFFSRAVLLHLGSVQVGISPDPSLFIWFLTWWPQAIAHRLEPFMTSALWAPAPFNIAWTTCIPLPSVIGAPLTIAAGPIVSFNVLCLLSLPLSAWCAALVCREVTHAYWPSVLGGYIFGFSPYMLGHLMGGQLHLVMAFPIPLAVYLLLLGINARLSPKLLCPLLALTLAAEFLCSIETFATMTLFGAATLFLGWSFAPIVMRRRLISVAIHTAGAYALMIVAVSPYLYFLFFCGSFPGRLWSPSSASTDLLNVIVPTRANELGLLQAVDWISATFRGPTGAEATGYLVFL
jgi:hypothetical protein